MAYIIAIDFGTAFSGYAFSLTPRGKDIVPQLHKWGKNYGKDTCKTPTCILFDEHEKFLKFGYEAQVAYTEMRGEEARGYLFFEYFKMSLYGANINRDLMIEAANGKSMKALKVFSEALRYLKEDALRTIEHNTSGKKFNASDFTWVVTVPAIWDPSAKQFMREAAEQAGIITTRNENNLVFALEPEAASIWCKKLPASGFITEGGEGEQLDQTPGTQYIVVDCGGGTVDITVHQVLNGGALKELHKASGSDEGGQSVDKKFKEFLRQLFCDSVWDDFERDAPSEVLMMMYDFTRFKTTYKDAQFSLPFRLGEIAKTKKEIPEFFKTVQGASWNNGSIKISKEKIKSFFDESLNSITQDLREILEKDLNVKYILLVGGYAQSEILRQHIIGQFPQYKVLCPSGPQEAVLKGAVMFGRNPELVASRKSIFTYGVEVNERFDESKHKIGKKITYGDDAWCDNIFYKLVDINEDVEWDKSKEYIFYPIEANQKKVRFSFFQTERTPSPLYVDEWGMEPKASLVIDMPDTKGGINRQIKMEIRFGFTEMIATVTDLTSKLTKSATIDFMTKSKHVSEKVRLAD